jgi:AraC family transcriptional regulator, regulatory protein of adaptative response / methylated-DNA-[protein]-cysteine methyltransferase
MSANALSAMLPSASTMYAAIASRDTAFDGVFLVGVRTTGIFCRPGCPARTPKPEHVEFFHNPADALFAGYRPCLRCRPLERTDAVPEWVRPLLAELEREPQRRWRDADLRAAGYDPVRVRRWFRGQHGVTFQAFQRARRIGRALGTLRQGGSVTQTAYEHGFESLSAFYDAFRGLLATTPARASSARPLHFTRVLTPLGPMLAAAHEEGLTLLEFTDRRMLETQLKRLGSRVRGTPVPGSNDVLDRAQQELDAYFKGVLREFSVPLAPEGTPFQKEAWRALQRIPYGETRSYAEQASSIGRPTATRAVARANGDNPVAIIVPCHRVVGADGRLTGYGGGLWRKQRLLDLERGDSGGLT